MKPSELQALDVIEVAKRVGCDLDKAGRMGDPMQVVMETLKCDKTKAEQWLFNEFKRQDKEPLELIEGNVRTLKLAQEFSEEVAFYTISLHAKKGHRVIRQPYLITSKRELLPCTETELSKRSICYDKIPFPDVRWPLPSVRQYLKGEETATLSQCYQAILTKANHHLDFGDKDISKMIALWCIGTMCYRGFESFPYLYLNGNAECGKTKTLSFIAHIAFNGEMMTSDSSRNAILRTIDANASTCCIDEVEGLQNPRDDDTRAMIAVLNSGYKLGGGDKKCEKVGKNDQWVPVFFDGYSPKVLAGIKPISPVLQSRCIQIPMLRSRNAEVLNRALSDRDPFWEQIRSMLYPAMLREWTEVQRVFSTMRSIVLTAREWELWKPIVALACIVDPSAQLANEMRGLAERMHMQRKEVEAGAPVLLAVLIELLEEDDEEEQYYSTDDLYKRLSELDEDEFGWLVDPTKKSYRGKWLGNELRRAGVVRGKAELRSVAGKKLKGYTLKLEHIRGLFSAFEVQKVTKEPSTASVKAKSAVTTDPF